MSTLSQYTVKEILSHLTGVLAIILGIFLVQRFASLLADATAGSFPVAAISHLLGLRTLMALPSLFPVTLYIAIFLSLGRFHQDHEMVALAGCGVPPTRIHRAVLLFAAFAALFNGVLSFSVRPWAAGRFQAVRSAAMSESKLTDVRPQRFYSFEDGDETVLFAEGRRDDEPGVLQGVFARVRHAGKLSVFSAKKALERRDTEHGFRFLHLFDGYRYDLDTKGNVRDITQYRELSIRTPLGGGPPPDREETRSAAALAASSDPKDAGELQWRIANAVSVLLLALLAIPLSHTNPRQGKYGRLFVAILLYVAYRSLLNAARHWIEDGWLPAFPGLWVVHALCFAVAVVLFVLGPDGRDLLAVRQRREAVA
jgi:lipopolysaccharide export system permease protein